jgi:hypothetical protein
VRPRPPVSWRKRRPCSSSGTQHRCRVLAHMLRADLVPLAPPPLQCAPRQGLPAARGRRVAARTAGQRGGRGAAAAPRQPGVRLCGRTQPRRGRAPAAHGPVCVRRHLPAAGARVASAVRRGLLCPVPPPRAANTCQRMLTRTPCCCC